MMEMSPQTDSGHAELVPADPLLPSHLFSAHLPSTQKTKKPGTIKKPDYGHLDTRGSVLPFLPAAFSGMHTVSSSHFPTRMCMKKNTSEDEWKV